MFKSGCDLHMLLAWGIRSLRREPPSDVCVYYRADWECVAQLEKVALVVLRPVDLTRPATVPELTETPLGGCCPHFIVEETESFQ